MTDAFMAEIPKAGDMVNETIQRELGDELDLVFQAGSLIKGTAHRYSDLDMFYVPKHEGTWNCITVSVQGTMIDLFPIHWPKLERMADFEDPSTSILLQNRVVYQGSAEAGERFRALADRVRANMEPGARPQMVERAMRLIEGAGYEYFLLKSMADANDMPSATIHASRVVGKVLQALAIANQALIDTRRFPEVLGLPNLPDGFEHALNAYAGAKDAMSLFTATEALMRGVRTLVIQAQRETQRAEASFNDLAGGYVELKCGLDHVLLSCDRGDARNAGSEVMGLHWEWARCLSEIMQGVRLSGNTLPEFGVDFGAMGFPDLIEPALTWDFDTLRERCHAFDGFMRGFLASKNVRTNTFDTLESLKEWLDARR